MGWRWKTATAYAIWLTYCPGEVVEDVAEGAMGSGVKDVPNLYEQNEV